MGYPRARMPPPPRLADLQTPALLIRLDLVRHNLARMGTYLGDDFRRWRPHVKTAKVPEVLAMVLATGVRQFKVATTRELEVLLDLSDEPIDVLMAMAQHGTNLERTAALAQAHPRHRCAMLSEDPDHVRRLRQLGLGVFLDLDPGYHRTGVPLADRSRIAALVAAAGPDLRGLHCYDGHLHGMTTTDRTAACRAIYSEVAALARTLPGDIELITSGTPTFPMALAYEPFRNLRHTISPGTVVYWDARSDELGIDGFQCAVTVLTRVISRPAADRITADAGSKAVDAAAGDPCAKVLGPWRLRPLTPSEEHLPMLVEGGDAPPLGELLRLVPRHVCPTVNLADDAVLLDQDERVHDIVPVNARGHETVADTVRIARH